MMRKRILREKHTTYNYTDQHIDHDLNIMTGDKIRKVYEQSIKHFYVYDTEWKLEDSKVAIIHYIEEVKSL